MSRPAEWDGAEPFAVDYCSSSSLLVRAETWDAIGGLDDAFFPAGHVDADLAMRIRRSGRALIVAPGARSRHRRGASSTRPFKRFIAVRNAELFRERWGEVLAAGQEPRGDAGAAAIERALARAAERRAVAAAEPPPRSAPAEPVPAPDPLALARRSLELHSAYEAELEPALEHFETEANELRARVAELDALLRERERQLAEITGGGWWRLRERLLPLLGVAAALRRRVRGA